MSWFQISDVEINVHIENGYELNKALSENSHDFCYLSVTEIQLIDVMSIFKLFVAESNAYIEHGYELRKTEFCCRK